MTSNVFMTSHVFGNYSSSYSNCEPELLVPRNWLIGISFLIVRPETLSEVEKFSGKSQRWHFGSLSRCQIEILFEISDFGKNSGGSWVSTSHVSKTCQTCFFFNLLGLGQRLCQVRRASYQWKILASNAHLYTEGGNITKGLISSPCKIF